MTDHDRTPPAAGPVTADFPLHLFEPDASGGLCVHCDRVFDHPLHVTDTDDRPR